MHLFRSQLLGFHQLIFIILLGMRILSHLYGIHGGGIIDCHINDQHNLLPSRLKKLSEDH